MATIMEGAVQRSGKRVRINVQLIDGNTDEHLWAEIYDRELTADNIFEIQSEITLAIASALKSVLTHENNTDLVEQPTQNLEAYDNYLKGMAILYEDFESQNSEAVAFFENAVAADPEFAAAHAGLSRAVLQLYWDGGSSKDAAYREAAKISLTRAQALAPNSVETLIAAGYFYYYGFLNYDRASEFIDQALTKAPNNAEVWALKAYVARRAGRFEETIRALRKSMELEPFSVSKLQTLNQTLILLGRFEEAQKVISKIREIAPGSERLAGQETYLLLTSGDVERLCHVSASTEPQAGWTYFYWAEYNCAIMRRDYAMAQIALNNIPEEEISSPEYPLLREIIAAWILEVSGNQKEARKRYTEISKKLGALDSPYPSGWNDGAFYTPDVLPGFLRDRDALATAVKDFEANVSLDAYHNLGVREGLVAFLARAGDFDLAFKYLQQNIDVVGYAWYPRISIDPLYDDLTVHPRFKAMEPEFQKWRATQDAKRSTAEYGQ